jgi:multimeric flavodoxin WrbA
MKVVAFNGSPRKGGNTSMMLRGALSVLEEEGIETELVEMANTPLRGCIACFRCAQNKDNHCALSGDALNGYIEKMLEADGIILGSPTYFADVTAEMKALIDRAGFVSKVNGDILKRKVGAAVVAVRRAGSVHVFDSINHFFTIGQMIVCGSSYWNMGIGQEIGEVDGDAEGMRTMHTLGENMAWLLKKLHA